MKGHVHLIWVLLLPLLFSCSKTEPETTEPEPTAEKKRALSLEPRIVGEQSAPEPAADKPSPEAEQPTPEAAPLDEAAVLKKEPPKEEKPRIELTPEDVTIQLAPAELDVMRDTTVRLTAELALAEKSDVVCSWDPGDRSGELRGCEVEHTFRGGLADRTVTLTLLSNEEPLLKKSVPLPLERLPVQPLKDTPALGTLPSPPDGATRIALAGLFSVRNESELAELDHLLADVSPTVSFLFVNRTVDAKTATKLDARFNHGHSWESVLIFAKPRKLRDGVIPKRIPNGFVAHGENNDFPFRGSMLGHGNLFLLLDSRLTGIHKSQEKWLLAELEGTQMTAHRLVLSAYPLEGYTDGEIPELVPQFRYYEKLLRGDPSLFVSSSHPVFYLAKYGQLPTLSVGCATGTPGKLPGAKTSQDRLITVVDLVPKQRPTVYGVKLGDTPTLVNPRSLPRKVGSYRRIF